MVTIHEVGKAPEVVKEVDEIEDGAKPKRVSLELNQNNIVQSVLVTSINPM